MTHHARESSHAFASVACFKLVLPVEREPTPACVVLGFMAVAWGSKEFLAELGDVEKLLLFAESATPSEPCHCALEKASECREFGGG